jgi:hypothetical protein
MTIKAVLDANRFTKAMVARAKRYPKATERGLLYAGYALQADSQRLVPVDTGQLKRSASTDIAKPKLGETAAVEVSYSTDYAIFVHERTDIPHYTPAEAQAKFLEQPAREKVGQYIDIIIQETK